MPVGHEFSDRPFIVGSLVGLRHVVPAKDAEGEYLKGPHAGYRYRPGENVGTCNVFMRDWERRKREHDLSEQAKADVQYQVDLKPGRMPGLVISQAEMARFNRMAHDEKLDIGLQLLNRNFVQHFARLSGNEDLLVVREPLNPYRPKPFEEPPPEGHQVGSIDCTCGFYAYFEADGRYMFGNGHNMAAIVEGYGVTVVGTRGFRCEKLKHLALIASPDAVSTQRDLTMEEFRRLVETYSMQQRIAEYYGVPLFDSLDQALAEFPLTKPEEA